jgi:hypothetical protein
MWRFNLCSQTGQSYEVETNLDANGNSTSEVVFPILEENGCSVPGEFAQPWLTPSEVTSSSSYLDGNFTFSIRQNRKTSIYSGICTANGAGACSGSLSDGSALTGEEFGPIAPQGYSGISNGSQATLTLISDTNQVLTASYEDGSGTYQLQAQQYGGTFLVTLQAGLVVAYMSEDCPEPACDMYLYGQDSFFVGALESASALSGQNP